MFASPLRRARQTAALAGYGDYRILPEIAEWDYGRAEGRTRQQVSEASGFCLGRMAGWSAFAEPRT